MTSLAWELRTPSSGNHTAVHERGAMISGRSLATATRYPGLVLSTISLRQSLPATFVRRKGGHALLRRPLCRAWQSTVAPLTPPSTPFPSSPASEPASSSSASREQETGHFDVKPNESLFFFENVFPRKLSFLLRYPTETDGDMTALLRRFHSPAGGGGFSLDPISFVKRAVPGDLPVKVTEIVPRLKDGGAFVKVQHDASTSPSDIEAKLLETLERRPLKPWFSPFRGVKARRVKGTPWLEDLYRFPSNLIKVEFVPPEPGAMAEELSEETLYSMFRRYGKIADIVPQPFDSKVVPKYAQVSFARLSDAIMARNCMHGFVVAEPMGGGKSGTLLRLSYVKRVKAHSIWNWLTSHPRIVIPILAALLAGASVMIFDPIRAFFIKLHVSHSLRFTESRLYKWFKSRTGSLSRRRNADGLNTVWNHRRDLIEQLRNWLDGSSDTFIVVTGPRGSGKIEMVMDQALAGRKNVLLMDCKPIVDASGEAGTIKRLASAVGFRPVFSWANSMSSLIDLAVQSTTGVKAGFSETLDTQVSKILHTTAAALKQIALSARSKHDKDAQLSEDAYLEAHPEKRPVVVIDNYLHKNEGMTIVYDKLADWAASLVQNKVAHVIFLTSDASSSKPLSRAMPDRVFRTLPLGDLDREVAKNLVVSRLAQDGPPRAEPSGRGGGDETAKRMDLTGLDECVETLGGRLTDLEFLSRRIRAGQTPRQAVDEIVSETATDIVKMFLVGGRAAGPDRKWSPEQAWHLIKSLADAPSLRYHQVLLSPAFAASTSSSAADGEAALEALAGAELIALTSHRGRPKLISAGKPLHQAAFALLVADRVLRAKMDMAVVSEMAKAEAKTIDAVETELSVLGRLPRQTLETAGRVTYLLSKLDASQRRIDELDRQMVGLKKVLAEEY
ncbi:Mitochondrial escape protein 2 [Metarhizium album ARSEF 1941]|uniref:Mitochondrial escape protein 2 n=1 Tax=Metarhizium album (strain ARSEF 1941) TaxID=1081103 RepID=A0A0B2WTJ4_METAS|nr:Mitochondrial escape protein 2 [Metarhizium album ARSEF 1941]KHN97368.1 Mitochondrial escape protein 2 [Metarhizium album ARSEF 1941]